uniref:Cell division cycle associated 7b n=1 Tax=Cyprinus carpio TaxID=7962 RepID=A0A8C1W053_CYPCA
MIKTRRATLKDVCFGSRNITEELAQAFMDTESEGEFKGFSADECDWRKPVSDGGSDEDSDDNGFYSDGEEPASKKQRSSGLCVAFKFPTKRGPAPKRNTAKKGNKKEAPPPAQPISRKPAGVNRKRREPEQSKESTLYERIRAESQSKPSENVTSVESLLTDEEMQILSKRAKNIKENKAMLAKLFADLSSLPELPAKTTSTKKKKQSTPKRRFSEVQVERRNPGRKARPPEHFGIEVEEKPAPQKRESGQIDIKRLMEVKEGLGDARPKQRKSRSRESIRMPEDISEEELQNVAERAKDKILDKENVSVNHCYGVVFLMYINIPACDLRAARVISAGRRPSTPRLSAGACTAAGSKVSSAAPVYATATEKTSAPRCWIPPGSVPSAEECVTAVCVVSAMADVRPGLSPDSPNSTDTTTSGTIWRVCRRTWSEDDHPCDTDAPDGNQTDPHVSA